MEQVSDDSTRALINGSDANRTKRVRTRRASFSPTSFTIERGKYCRRKDRPSSNHRPIAHRVFSFCLASTLIAGTSAGQSGALWTTRLRAELRMQVPQRISVSYLLLRFDSSWLLERQRCFRRHPAFRCSKQAFLNVT